ncbi:hypothetical protein [Aeribacillus pallidus]|uniref:hypothetical protein n=1 Tax=Aeribacillus pallidus TaxID=33936 RepID=UPI000E3528F7|nr:hypothetical protein [Aeribacillus pallidus]
MAKKGSQKTIEVEGKKYILQHPGTRFSVKMRDMANVNGQFVEEKYYEELMKHVIFTEEGKQTNWDYWDEHEGFAEVIKEAVLFLNA